MMKTIDELQEELEDTRQKKAEKEFRLHCLIRVTPLGVPIDSPAGRADAIKVQSDIAEIIAREVILEEKIRARMQIVTAETNLEDDEDRQLLLDSKTLEPKRGGLTKYVKKHVDKSGYMPEDENSEIRTVPSHISQMIAQRALMLGYKTGADNFDASVASTIRKVQREGTKPKR